MLLLAVHVYRCVSVERERLYTYTVRRTAESLSISYSIASLFLILILLRNLISGKMVQRKLSKFRERERERTSRRQLVNRDTHSERERAD